MWLVIFTAGILTGIVFTIGSMVVLLLQEKAKYIEPRESESDKEGLSECLSDRRKSEIEQEVNFLKYSNHGLFKDVKREFQICLDLNKKHKDEINSLIQLFQNLAKTYLRFGKELRSIVKDTCGSSSRSRSVPFLLLIQNLEHSIADYESKADDLKTTINSRLEEILKEKSSFTSSLQEKGEALITDFNKASRVREQSLQTRDRTRKELTSILESESTRGYPRGSAADYVGQLHDAEKDLKKSNRDMLEKESIFQEKMRATIVALYSHTERTSFEISQILLECSITKQEIPMRLNDEWINDFVARAFRDASSRLSSSFSKWSVR
jgi:MFS superfamily sulfate permease-like transporter